MREFSLEEKEFNKEVSILFPITNPDLSESIIESFKKHHEKLGYMLTGYEVIINLEENIGVFKATLTKLKVFNRLKWVR